jgi:uncharacterized protein (TIGR02996 family)
MPKKKRTVKGASHPQMEHDLLSSPERMESYQIYGDWLQQQGDPRGDLVALQVAQRHARGPALAALIVQQRALLKKHSKYFFGPVNRFQAARLTDIDWFCGFVDEMRGGFSGQLLGHPSAQFVRRLGGVAVEEVIPPALTHLRTDQVDVSNLSAAPTLRWLTASGDPIHLGDKPFEQLEHLHVDPHPGLQPALFPALKTLSVGRIRPGEAESALSAVARFRDVELSLALDGYHGEAHFPGLPSVSERVTRLALRGMGIGQLHSIAPVGWPAVQELEVFGISRGARDAMFQSLPALPALQMLRLMYPSNLVSVFRGLAHSEVAQQIRTLHVGIKGPGPGRALVEVPYSRVEALHLNFDRIAGPNYHKSERLFDSGSFPALRRLHLDPPWHLPTLAQSGLAGQLETVEVHIEKDREADQVIQALPRMTALKSLVLGGCRKISDDRLTTLLSTPLDVTFARSSTPWSA